MSAVSKCFPFVAITGIGRWRRRNCSFRPRSFRPRVFSPPVFSPPVCSPPVLSPPVFSPPGLFAPGSFRPRSFRPQSLRIRLFRPALPPALFAPLMGRKYRVTTATRCALKCDRFHLHPTRRYLKITLAAINCRRTEKEAPFTNYTRLSLFEVKFIRGLTISIILEHTPQTTHNSHIVSRNTSHQS